MRRETDRLGNIWETRNLSEIDRGFRPVRNPADYRDIYGKYYDPKVWVITGKEEQST